MKMFILLILCFIVVGCDDSDIKTQDKMLNNMKKPLVIAARGSDGGVLIRAADGKCYLARYDTYLGLALKNTNVNDVIIP